MLAGSAGLGLAVCLVVRAVPGGAQLVARAGSAGLLCPVPVQAAPPAERRARAVSAGAVRVGLAVPVVVCCRVAAPLRAAVVVPGVELAVRDVAAGCLARAPGAEPVAAGRAAWVAEGVAGRDFLPVAALAVAAVRHCRVPAPGAVAGLQVPGSGREGRPLAARVAGRVRPGGASAGGRAAGRPAGASGPMAPISGSGSGDARRRKTWLIEDDDVWGTHEGQAAPEVLGREPDRRDG